MVIHGSFTAHQVTINWHYLEVHAYSWLVLTHLWHSRRHTEILHPMKGTVCFIP